MRDLQPGDPERVGPFRLVGRLGAGGMGLVYAGQDSTGRRAAVKVVQPLLAHDAAFRSRFAREAQLLGRIEGACTARVLAADVEHEPPYLAVEFVPGPTLAEQVEGSGPLAPELLLPLAVGLAEALVAIHAVGVVHRDLKPANVVLSDSGPKVIDFGVSYLLDATSITSGNQLLGSPGWMAPEQFTSPQTAPPSDVFSLASTVVYAATGEPPFGGGSVEAVHYRLTHHTPDLSGLPEPLRSGLAAAFRKDPADRPTAAQLLGLLAEEAPEAARAHTPTLLLQTWHFSPVAPPEWSPPAAGPRRRTYAVVAAAAALALVAGTVGWVAHDPPARATAAVVQPSPTPSPTPQVLFSNSACEGKRCTLLGSLDDVPAAVGVVHAEVDALPDDSEGRPQLLVALYEQNDGSVLHTTATFAATYPAAGQQLSSDRDGHVFVPVDLPGGGSTVVVLAADSTGVQEFDSVPTADSSGRFGSVAVPARAVDIEGDGVDEVVVGRFVSVGEAAEQPYERFYAFEAGDWVLVGCSPVKAGTTPARGPTVKVDAVGCAPDDAVSPTSPASR